MMERPALGQKLNFYVISHQHTLHMQLQNEHRLLATQLANWQPLRPVAVPEEDMWWPVFMTHLIILLLLGVILWDWMSKYMEGKEMDSVWA